MEENATFAIKGAQNAAFEEIAAEERDIRKHGDIQEFVSKTKIKVAKINQMEAKKKRMNQRQFVSYENYILV